MERSLPGVHFIDDGENKGAPASSAAASNFTVASSGTAISNTAAVISSLPPRTTLPSTPTVALPVITSSVPRLVVSESKPVQILRQPVASAAPTTFIPMRPKEEPAEPSMSASAASSAGQSLIDFLEKVDSYKPTIPETIVQYHMQCAGLSTTDPRVTQLIALASQKFISDIVNDTFIHQNIKKSSDKKPTLTLDALAPVLGDYGFKIKKPTYMQ